VATTPPFSEIGCRRFLFDYFLGAKEQPPDAFLCDQATEETTQAGRPLTSHVCGYAHADLGRWVYNLAICCVPPITLRPPLIILGR
jgi:hypothetical protein